MFCRPFKVTDSYDNSLLPEPGEDKQMSDYISNTYKENVKITTTLLSKAPSRNECPDHDIRLAIKKKKLCFYNNYPFSKNK